MAGTLIPKGARVSFALNGGTNPGTGIMKKIYVSLSKIVNDSDVDTLNDVAVAVGGLFARPVVEKSLISTEALV